MESEHEELLKERQRNKRFRKQMRIFMVVFGAVAIFGIYSNTQRIHDIQQSRLTSCQRNYITTREIFKPFFPPKKHRTAKQAGDIKRFIKLTNPNKCYKQVKTK